MHLLSPFIWLILALVASVMMALQHIYAKQATRTLTPTVAAWGWIVTAAIPLAPLAFLQPLPTIPTMFWLLLGLRTIIDVTALTLYMKAMREADASLVAPIAALSPVFIAASSFVLNGQTLVPLGIIGVVLITLGAYQLSRPKNNSQFFAPIRAIVTRRPLRLALISIAIQTVSLSLLKMAIDMTNPFFCASVATGFFVVGMTALVLWTSRTEFFASLRLRQMYPAMRVGIVDGIGFGCTLTALHLKENALVIAVRHTNIALVALFAWWILKEDIRPRIVPIGVMLIGTLLVTLA